MTYATNTDDWFRRDADAKIPSLPTGDYDFDHALSQLRNAVAEIDQDSSASAVSAVLRILRDRRGLAAQLLAQREPTCLNCGGGKKCLGCDDTRPSAEKLAPGWRFVSPVGREETVERVEQATDHSPVRVWTDKTGADYSWLIPLWRKLDAVAPLRRSPQQGTPEIRIVEYDYSRDAPMYAQAALSTTRRPDNAENCLAEARYSREHGWRVVHRPDGGGEMVVIDCGRSKARARTALRQAARQHARALGVKVVEQAKERGR
ncbi:hypothetical protein [Verrucosispora sp. TAA-831]|uniref:hypothetical protein n=1 Tax=Verrucosispora sp. TAA-831 TaxID=3422227 RepID=UPI003D700C22